MGAPEIILDVTAACVRTDQTVHSGPVSSANPANFSDYGMPVPRSRHLKHIATQNAFSEATHGIGVMPPTTTTSLLESWKCRACGPDTNGASRRCRYEWQNTDRSDHKSARWRIRYRTELRRSLSRSSLRLQPTP